MSKNFETIVIWLGVVIVLIGTINWRGEDLLQK